MTSKIPLKIGDLIQLKPDHENVIFTQCILIVEEITSTGCHAYVQEVGRQGRPGPHVPLAVDWGDFEVVGHAKWHIYSDAAD